MEPIRRLGVVLAGTMLALALLLACAQPPATPTVAPTAVSEAQPTTTPIPPSAVPPTVAPPTEIALPTEPVPIETSSGACLADASWVTNPQLLPEVPSRQPGDTSPPFCRFDSFAWESFLALVQPTGEGELLEFETWMPKEAVFKSDGTPPNPWGDPVVPNSCPAGTTRVMGLLQKSDADLADEILQATGQPLVDQRGRWVYYEQVMSEPQYNYIAACTLWESSCYDASPNLFFPPIPSTVTSTIPLTLTGNSIEVKTAWRVMETCNLPDSPASCTPEDTSSYYTISAAVLPYSPTLDACTPVTLGLVGFHIVYKTLNHPEWVWMTFEHADTAPDCEMAAESEATPFFNPACTGNACAFNTFNNPCGSDNQFDPTCQMSRVPTQVCRTDPVTDTDILTLNESVHTLLPAGSVWANYNLIGTLWTTDGGDPQPTTMPINTTVGITNGNEIGNMFLANLTMETYFQSPLGASKPNNCFTCHDGSFSSAGNFPEADFSHFFSDLKAPTNSCTVQRPSFCGQATTP